MLLLLGLLGTDSSSQPASTISSPRGRTGQCGEGPFKSSFRAPTAQPAPSPRPAHGTCFRQASDGFGSAARPCAGTGGACARGVVMTTLGGGVGLQSSGRGWSLQHLQLSPRTLDRAFLSDQGSSSPLPSRSPSFSSETELNLPSPGGEGPLPLFAGSLFYEVEVKYYYLLGFSTPVHGPQQCSVSAITTLSILLGRTSRRAAHLRPHGWGKAAQRAQGICSRS